MMRAAPIGQQSAVDGQVLWNGVKQVSACAEEPILCIAQSQSLTLVVFREARLVVSWRFPLSVPVEGTVVFGIPPLIVAHLSKSPLPTTATARITITGNDVTLGTNDAAGPFELRWRSDLAKFPAPPELNRLLTAPAAPIALNYLEVADSIHGAVARLMSMEIERHIHRTKLAVLLSISGERLVVDGQEVGSDRPGFYYFDPRLMMRALECIRSDKVLVGLTELGPCRAFLSLVDRQPDRTVHCALLSVGLDTQRIIAPERGPAAWRG